MAASFAAMAQELARERHGPRAFVVLSKLRDLEDQLPETAPMAALYRQTAGDHRALPEVRGFARFLLAQFEQSRGRLQRAAIELGELGFIGEWQISGPFDNEGKRGFDTVFPPERSQDLGARSPGKVRQ